MKLFRNILDSVKPNFEKGGKLEKLYPAYDAFETFLFVPGHVTKKGTHIKDSMDLKRTMVFVILALVPCLLFGMYNAGLQHYLAVGEEATFFDMFLWGAIKVMPIVAVSYIAGLSVEFAFAVIKKHSVEEGFLVSGMLIPLCMPMDTPLWMVALATIFAVIIGKEVFGGTGMNILNVALTARAFLFFAYPTMMSGNKVWVDVMGSGGQAAAVDGYTGETMLAQATYANADQFTNIAGTAYASASDVWTSAFLGFIPGSIGETSTLACLIGAALLLYTGIASWRVMLSFLLGGAAMGLIFNAFAVNTFMAIPWFGQLIMGGFAFGMVFMATDPVTAAQTNTGKWIYGFFAGFFGIMIRVFNPAYPEGIMLGILFMNVMAPMIDHYVVEANVKRRLKRLKAATAAAPAAA